MELTVKGGKAIVVGVVQQWDDSRRRDRGRGEDEDEDEDEAWVRRDEVASEVARDA